MPGIPRLCGCGAIVAADQLCQCQIERQRDRKARHDRNRPNSRQRGYTREWEKARAEFLTLHPFCAMCGNPADLVDHVTPHRGDKALFWNWNNWASLCTHCHSSKKQRIERAEAKIHV